MRVKAVGFSFQLLEGESLMALVKQCGYSKPSKEDPIARRTLTGYGEGSGEDIDPVVEVQRKDANTVFVKIIPGDFEHLTPHLVNEVWNDLKKAKLVSDD